MRNFKYYIDKQTFLWLQRTIQVLVPYKYLLLSLLCFNFSTVYAQTKPIIGDYDEELRLNGHVDTKLLVQRLVELRANTYFYLIRNSIYDWADLNNFLPKSKIAGINVWVYLVPPNEDPKKQLPYTDDYVKWAREIAKLSLQYSNLKGWVIDDFWSNTLSHSSSDLFSAKYIKHFVNAGKAINPKIKFYPLMYFESIDENNEFGTLLIDSLSTIIDGVIGAYPSDTSSIALALSYLNDNIPEIDTIRLPRNTHSSAGDYGYVTQTVIITDTTNISIRLKYWDSNNEKRSSYHKMRLYADDNLIWNKDATGPADSTITLDLTNTLKNKGTSIIKIGIYENASVSNHGITAIFQVLSSNGLNFTNSSWKNSIKGSFKINKRLSHMGRNQFHLPLIVMPAASVEEYRLRYSDIATPENIASRIGSIIPFILSKQIEGMVTFSLDKKTTSTTFEPVKQVFQSFWDQWK